MAACHDEYDPEFYHASATQHKAAEWLLASPKRSAAAGASRPVVAAPPPPHPFFAPVRALLYAPPLLSLVRSATGFDGDEGTTGFLNVSNRVVVALSRARCGFYCVGDLSMLAASASVRRGSSETLNPIGLSEMPCAARWGGERRRLLDRSSRSVAAPGCP